MCVCVCAYIYKDTEHVRESGEHGESWEEAEQLHHSEEQSQTESYKIPEKKKKH